MPDKCCVPNCRGNYRATKEHTMEKVSVFGFPTDPERCAKWVRMIPREDLEVNDRTVVCEKHFVPEFIIRVDSATRADGSILTVPRKNPKLASDAYPSLFPNNSSYLSSKPPKKRKSPAARLAEQTARDNEGFLEWMQDDQKRDIPLATTETFNHFMNITETLMKFRKKGFLCDTVLIAKCGSEVKAHSTLLAAVSPVFLMAIQEKPSSGICHLCFPEVDLDVLEIAVHFVYTGKLLLPTIYSQMDLLSKLFDKLSVLGLNLQNLHECEKTFVRNAKQPPNSMALSISLKVEDADSNTNVKDFVQELQASCEWPVDNKPSSAEGFNEAMIVDMAPRDAGMRRDTLEKRLSTLAKKKGQRICEQERLKRKHRKPSNNNGKKEGMPSNTLVPTGTGARRPVMRPAFSILKSVLGDLNSSASAPNSLSIVTREQNSLQIGLLFDQNVRMIDTLDSDSYGRHWAIVNENGEENPQTQVDILGLVEPSPSEETLAPNGVEQLEDKASVSGNQALGCEICKEPNAMTFTNEIELLWHKIKHHWDQCNACNYCGHRLSSSKNLKVHIMRHLGICPQKNHKCNDRGLHFIGHKSLNDHRVQDTGEKPHECSYCKKRFALQENMKRHQLLHSGYHRFLCDFCGKGFSRKIALMEHVTLHHKFECALCNCKQTSKANMEKHAREVHQVGEHVKFSTIIKHTEAHLCDLCGENCISAYSLRSHLKRHKKKSQLHIRPHTGMKQHRKNPQFHMNPQTGERPIICHVCQKGFRYKSLFELHFATHSGIKPFHCDICSRSFPIKSLLKQHVKQHTMTLSEKRRFKCGICNKLFTCKASLGEHIRIHTGERPYKCEICSKQFTCKSTLTVHIRTHTGDKPFACTECKMSFAHSPHLGRHMRTHTGERPFVCEICSKSYKNKIDLRYHLMRFHKINVTSKSPLNSIENVKVPVAPASRDCIEDKLKHELDK